MVFTKRQMVMNIMEFGKMIKLMVKERIKWLMEIYIKGNGKTQKKVVLEF